MKSGFYNPLETKEKKKFKNPWSFTQPAYDQRSSSFIEAGTDHGTGKVNPVGSKGKETMTDLCMPSGVKIQTDVDKLRNNEMESQ